MVAQVSSFFVLLAFDGFIFFFLQLFNLSFQFFDMLSNVDVFQVNPCSDFIKDIYAEALWAEQVGLNSVWIGEHHFNLLGVNASPLAMLAQLAGATTKLRLAPAVTLLPVHHPLHVAEEWATLDLLSGGRVDFAAGRGYDRKEYDPFQMPFDDSAELFAEEPEEIMQMAYLAHMQGILGKSPRVDYTPNPATGDEMQLAAMTPTASDSTDQS